MNKIVNSSWTPDDSAELYGVRDWGVGYYDVSDKGLLTVSTGDPDSPVTAPLLNIVQDIRERGLDAPVLIRFEDILEQQIGRLNIAFKTAIDSAGYNGQYRGVFPIKVNQQCHVIEEIATVGAQYGHGLEAGSKPELIIALAHLESPDAHIICNGYKDQEFIDLGLQATKMGYSCFFVIETPSELPILLERSRALNIKPLIGVRVKLASVVGGHWNATSGDRSIFGLSIAQLIEMIDTLREEAMLDCLQLLHYHLGSQIPNIRDIRSGVVEACQVYMELLREGADMQFLDLGGGLAVDYDGSKTNHIHSKNYTVDEYCADIIDVVMSTLDPEGIEHPTIITESGRATIAYSSVLIFNVLDVASSAPGAIPDSIPEDEHPLLHSMKETLNNLCEKNMQECYNDAVFYRDEVRDIFKRGQIGLRSRSLAENLFLLVMNNILALSETAARPLQEIDILREQLSDIYYGNFSLFQSLPDVWAIDQIFPIAPIHRLDERPTREAIIADITCDCDGKIDRFTNMHETKKTIGLHPLKDDEDYFIGVFLVGAYQETLGDLHNLFGDPNVVSVRLHTDGSYEFADEIEGDSISDVLSYVEYQPQQLRERFRKIAERSVRQGQITASERQTIMKAFSASMQGYTYYEKD
ncbi:biosynthetic arginine decarboxylase [Teredinibacter purpureus]|uniref:biosynthetic arginine decarboxylase n=1 Tax=Teredinibacter purpureus TaxID=2731756 RepID=UPI0005F83145|nr:biosynthetic arginine decarboxylase [Teredinibacter purpureus]